MQANLLVRESVRFVLSTILLASMLFAFAGISNVAIANSLSSTFNGHCYTFVNTFATWTMAQAAATATPSAGTLCEGSTGYLAVINSAAENAYVQSLIVGKGAWLGGKKVGNNWQWVSIPGTPTFCIQISRGDCPAEPGWYTNWGVGLPSMLPNNTLLFIYGSNGTWTGGGLTDAASYVIEYDSALFPTAPKEVPEADTLLLLGGGMSGLGIWLRWQWSKRRKK